MNNNGTRCCASINACFVLFKRATTIGQFYNAWTSENFITRIVESAQNIQFREVWHARNNDKQQD